MAMLAQQPVRIGHPILGYIIPAVVFGLSFLIAYLLYRHYSKKTD